MMRYIVQEPEQFISLLRFWSETKEIYFPVFVEWKDTQNEGISSATYRIHADEYIAEVTFIAETAEQVADFGERVAKSNQLIEVISYELDDEM